MQIFTTQVARMVIQRTALVLVLLLVSFGAYKVLSDIKTYPNLNYEGSEQPKEEQGEADDDYDDDDDDGLILMPRPFHPFFF